MNKRIYHCLMMLPLKLLIAISLLFLSSLISVQAEQREHYTCYVLLEDQSKVVHKFVSVDETKSEFLESLPKLTVFAADGVTGSTIDRVYECVTANQRFSSKEARKLVLETPM